MKVIVYIISFVLLLFALIQLCIFVFNFVNPWIAFILTPFLLVGFYFWVSKFAKKLIK